MTVEQTEWEPTTRPVIVCSAVKLCDGTILLGIRHWDTNMRLQYRAKYGKNALEASWRYKLVRFLQGRPQPPRYPHLDDQGFFDQFSRYYTREEAMVLAKQNGQIIVPEYQMLSLTALHSEDLW